MAIPGGPEVLVFPAFVLLVVGAFVAKFLLKWIREGYEEEVTENRLE
ncbi:hypothetical protein OB914_00230 [Halobacteria archaeon HArc-curdl7]|uniref:Uncharacterized protein n=1 Tax=Halapricum hydrolyticum TaxID=2979991 RepID=A0AAE3IBG3_9EURY|nr:hypothetical protein [Halapricum hydrolyticum]